MRQSVQKTADNANRAETVRTERGGADEAVESGLLDLRPQAALGKTMQAMADASPRGKPAAQLKEILDNSPAHAPDQASASVQRQENRTGLPDQLKSGVESLSGMSMDHVQVHYNSDKPAQLNAHAYAQGSEIHVAPGQETHLPHEAWHVVQQAQGRVEPTTQLKQDGQGMPVNDDVGLEREADVMGARALSHGAAQLAAAASPAPAFDMRDQAASQAAIQRRQQIQRMAIGAAAHSSRAPVQRKVPVAGVVPVKGVPDPVYELDNTDFIVTEVSAPAATADYAPAGGDPALDPNRPYLGGEAGYLVNISSMNKTGAPAAVDQGDVKASITVARYQDGFADPIEAKNRLRMVVNVNQYDNPLGGADAAPAVQAALLAERLAVANAPGKASVIGYKWEHSWKRSDTGVPATVAAVRADYDAAKLAGTPEGTLKNGYKKVKFRYGKMREYSFNHPETANFNTQLSSRKLSVFVHSGDGDVISVKKHGVGAGIYDRVDAYRAQAGKQGIKLIGGGITNQGQNNGGDAPANQAWGIKTAHDLDMSHRQSMAGEFRSSPWMTEPNTFIDYDTLHKANANQPDWEQWENYMIDFGSALSDLVDDSQADFDFSALSIVSSANSHHLPVGTTDATLNSAKFATALFKHKDTSITPSAWLRRVAYHAIPTLEAQALPQSTAQTTYGASLKERAKWMAGKLLEVKAAGIVNADIKKEMTGRLTAQLGNVAPADQVAQTAPPWYPDSIAMVDDMADNLVDILNQADGLFQATVVNAAKFGQYGAGGATYAETIAGAAPAPALFKH